MTERTDPDAVMVMAVLLASPRRDDPGILLAAAKAYEALKSSRERSGHVCTEERS